MQTVIISHSCVTSYFVFFRLLRWLTSLLVLLFSHELTTLTRSTLACHLSILISCSWCKTLSRVVTLVKERAHIRPSLKRLHWLPIRQRADFKVALLRLCNSSFWWTSTCDFAVDGLCTKLIITSGVTTKLGALGEFLSWAPSPIHPHVSHPFTESFYYK